ncbi:DNA-cytosine methyltransferase [Klebsiella oxytoca]|nr:DNA-cytosine methyltransferase [Klebsiella oxytoca]
MVTSAKIVGLVEVMAQNLSKENPPSFKVEHTEEDAQTLLRQLMAIYDVKTLVAQLVAVGEQHWSPAILKRVATVSRAAGRISAQEQAHLRSLLPQPSSASSPLWIPLRRPVRRHRWYSSRF